MFASLAAHQMLSKMGVLLGLLLKPRLFEQLQSAPLGASVVPPMMDLARLPCYPTFKGEKIHLITDIPNVAVQK